MRIELRNVDVDLGGQPILRDINLGFEPGQITAVVGRSGCGLSVFLKTAAGLIPPSKGCVLYDDRDLDSLDESEKARLQARTGFMFQDAALWSNMSLASNLDLPLQTKFPDLDEFGRRQRVTDAFEEFGISLDLNQRPVELSQGEQKFMSFLRAVLPEPEAMFLDTPIALLDGSWVEIIMRKLAEMRAAGVVIVLGSHSSHLPVGLADSVVILKQGSVLAADHVQEICKTSDPEIRQILDGMSECSEWVASYHAARKTGEPQ